MEEEEANVSEEEEASSGSGGGGGGEESGQRWPFISRIISKSFISFSKLLSIFVCEFMKHEVSRIKFQS